MLWKKATILGAAGFVLGILICMGFRLAMSQEGLQAGVLPHILLGGIYGAVAMGSSVIYDIEKWSIIRATVTHFILVFGLYCLIGFSAGWFRLDEPVFWMIMAAMITGYVLIWLFQYLSYKRKVQQMNDDLKKWKSGNKAD